jgi:hypothetical protein
MRSEENLWLSLRAFQRCVALHLHPPGSSQFPDFLMVGSQIASLTPDPSFCHNLCCRCPNGSCETIFDIYTSIIFQCHEERLKAKCFDPYNQTLKFRESRRTPKSPFRECECHPHTLPKVGLRQLFTMLC